MKKILSLVIIFLFFFGLFSENFAMETKSVDIYRQEDDKYYVSLSSVLGTINNSKAECTLSSYTLDRWREEMEAKFFRENPIVD